MGRPPLPVGGHGDILARQIRPKLWHARVYVRDLDGHRREVARRAATKTAAMDAVQRALADRPGHTDSAITGETLVSVVADVWYAVVQREVSDGIKSSETARTYRSVLDTHILPAVGALRCREATLARLEAFLEAKAAVGVSGTLRKSIKSVLSGVMGTAARHGAIPTNPIRDTSRVVAKAKREPRALTAEEIGRWLDHLDTDRSARAHDLADITMLMLATGVRISEMLAVRTQDVDLDEATITASHRIKRVTGQGLSRVERGATSSKGRPVTLRLPGWAVGICRRRILELGGDGPLFPTARGVWRDPTNTAHAFARARGKVGLDWLTSHTYRKTVATLLDEGGLTARQIADQLTHRKISMTQDVYMGRGVVGDQAAQVLELHDPTRRTRPDQQEQTGTE